MTLEEFLKSDGYEWLDARTSEGTDGSTLLFLTKDGKTMQARVKENTLEVIGSTEAESDGMAELESKEVIDG